MQTYQRHFIDFLLKHKALSFGKFTLKSGRISPYFFNLGTFNTGGALAKLGEFYAQTIEQANLKYDMLFGPAYKGIPLVCTTSIALCQQFQKDLPYCFNRKEAKDHGEKGNLVGAPLHGRVILIDDVITAGTAVRETMSIIRGTDAQLAGIVIAFDRQERGKGQQSAIEEAQQQYQVPIVSIVTLSDVIQYLNKHDTLSQHISAIEQYREEYGV